MNEFQLSGFHLQHSTNSNCQPTKRHFFFSRVCVHAIVCVGGVRFVIVAVWANDGAGVI